MDIFRFLGSFLQSQSALAAKNLFLRKQLSFYQERQVRPHRATDATRLAMVLMAKLFDWSIPQFLRNGGMLWRKNWANALFRESGEKFSCLEAWLHLTNVLATSNDDPGWRRAEGRNSSVFGGVSA
jgi:hypothetical protein